MNYLDKFLDNRDFSLTTAPLRVYCYRSSCNAYIHKGDPVKKYDAATFTHVVCPSTPLRTFAAHKNPDFK